MRLSSTAGLALHAPVALLGTGLLIALGLARERPALIALGVLGSIVYAAIVLRRPLRRMRALRRPFPAPWRELLRRRIRFYERLDPAGRARFERNVTIVLADYRFEGIGVPIDDELRLLAASGAAMLIHGLEGFEYPGVRSIVLYPNHFDEAYRVGAELPIAGMVHGQGPIVFSAAALRQGFSREKDGHN
ncbi:MAG: zinc-dependent peptidase, partial [Myxococcales bacterium]|nr:zinc-dependent peptidase [Myxococcales bacterium]